MQNLGFIAKKCSDPFFTDCFQRFVQCCLVGRKEIIPHGGRTRFIDHFKRPVGRLKPIDIDVYFSSILSNSTRQRRMNKFWIAHAFLPTSAYSSHHIRLRWDEKAQAHERPPGSVICNWQRSDILIGRLQKRVASLTWWKLPMAVISSGDVIGLCHQIKNLLGRGDMQGLPAVNFAKGNLLAGQ